MRSGVGLGCANPTYGFGLGVRDARRNRRISAVTCECSLTLNAVQIHSAVFPIGGLQPVPNEPVEAAVGPMSGSCHVSMLDGVGVDVLEMSDDVRLVAKVMLPETILPRLAARSLTPVLVVMFGEPGLDETPPGREIAVAGR